MKIIIASIFAFMCVASPAVLAAVQTKFYESLQVKPTASFDEIKKAYRRMAQKFHPDKFENESQEEIDKATKAFQIIKEMYNVLRDPHLRRMYDNGELDELEFFANWNSELGDESASPKSNGVEVDLNRANSNFSQEGYNSNRTNPQANTQNTFNRLLLQTVFLEETNPLGEYWTNYLEHTHPKTERSILKKFNNIFQMGEVDLSAQNSEGKTTLHLVISPPRFFSYFKAAQWLIQRGAKINIPDGDGNSPVHKVFQMRPTRWDDFNPLTDYTDYTIQNDKRALKMLKILASGTEKINAQIENNKGETPLDMAVNKGYWRAVYWMIGQTGIDNLSPEERSRILTSDFKSNQSAHAYAVQTIINEIGGHNLGLEERREILTAAFTAKKQRDAMKIIQSIGNLSQEEQAKVRVMAVEKGWMKIARLFGKPRILTDQSGGSVNQFLNFCKRQWESRNVN